MQLHVLGQLLAAYSSGQDVSDPASVLLLPFSPASIHRLFYSPLTTSFVLPTHYRRAVRWASTARDGAAASSCAGTPVAPSPVPAPAMATSAGPLHLPPISPRQLARYFARTILHHPTSMRVTPPTSVMRLPPPPSSAAVAAGEPGVGVFFYPAAAEVKTAAFAAGTLGETVTPLHDVRVQTARALAGRRRAEAELLLWGAGGTASLVRSAVVGVSDGYAITLRLDGTGFRVESKVVEAPPPLPVAAGGEGGTSPAKATPAAPEEVVLLRIGFSNVHTLPAVDPVTGVRLIVLGPQALQVAGIEHQAVHQMAAKVRALRPAARDPYKNKGIRYEGEPLRKKESKKDS